ncbi:MAG: cyclodeaminase/cyclohydrolase family protein, partial [Spirochaetaceae bacterium]|nr:cyclodeaminase/cyclohydrolase family protein [Spirochaetaceae bacterium]
MGSNTGIPEKKIIQAAILGLGLNDTSPFIAGERVIEYTVEGESTGLTALTVSGFSDELSSDSMAPGGGSVSALSASLSASLTSMVANLTFGKKGYERQSRSMQEISIRAQELRARLLGLVD